MSHLYGKLVWFEYMSGDSVSASRFYDALFGWRTVDTPMGGPQPYPLIMNGSEGIGGFRARRRARRRCGCPTCRYARSTSRTRQRWRRAAAR